MATYKAQVEFPALVGTSADITVNSFYMDRIAADLTLGLATEWRDNIQGFYEAFDAFGGMFGYDMELGRVKFYNVETPEPNYPLFELDVICDNTSIPFQLPPEVALCVSYHNDTETLIPRGRRRGRIYISGWGTANNGTDGRPTSTAYNGLLTAFTGYVNAVNSTTGTAVLWSPTAASSFEIQRITVDNEWDTQRRRGRDATLTVSAVATPP